jgi:hypothetical protein
MGSSSEDVPAPSTEEATLLWLLAELEKAARTSGVRCTPEATAGICERLRKLAAELSSETLCGIRRTLGVATPAGSLPAAGLAPCSAASKGGGRSVGRLPDNAKIEQFQNKLDYARVQATPKVMSNRTRLMSDEKADGLERNVATWLGRGQGARHVGSRIDDLVLGTTEFANVRA